jgi:hypothetical protein
MARSTYWVGRYHADEEGYPFMARGGLSLAQARRLERRWSCGGLYGTRILRRAADGQYHELRSFQSQLPEEPAI